MVFQGGWRAEAELPHLNPHLCALWTLAHLGFPTALKRRLVGCAVEKDEREHADGAWLHLKL
jgi:hypothetical protein